VLVDVSIGAALDQHLEFALARRTPLVIGTTGWSMPELERRVGSLIGVLVAPNFSLTIAFLTRLVGLMGRYAMLDPAADVFIAEHHHARKKDAPSGTAKIFAQALLEQCPKKTRWTLAPAERALAQDELCVSVLRGGHTASQSRHHGRHARRSDHADARGRATCRRTRAERSMRLVGFEGGRECSRWRTSPRNDSIHCSRQASRREGP
jgi:4-hydroxy-tetrahydrodipicolinate reductase